MGILRGCWWGWRYPRHEIFMSPLEKKVWIFNKFSKNKNIGFLMFLRHDRRKYLHFYISYMGLSQFWFFFKIDVIIDWHGKKIHMGGQFFFVQKYWFIYINWRVLTSWLRSTNFFFGFDNFFGFFFRKWGGQSGQRGGGHFDPFLTSRFFGQNEYPKTTKMHYKYVFMRL